MVCREWPRTRSRRLPPSCTFALSWHEAALALAEGLQRAGARPITSFSPRCVGVHARACIRELCVAAEALLYNLREILWLFPETFIDLLRSKLLAEVVPLEVSLANQVLHIVLVISHKFLLDFHLIFK